MGHAGRVWNLTLSPAAHMLASAGQDGTARVWEGEGSREFLKLAGACDAMVGFADGGRTVLCSRSRQSLVARTLGCSQWRIARSSTHRPRWNISLQPIHVRWSGISDNQQAG